MLFILFVYNYLSCQQPVDHDILVVEGWLTDKSLEKAKDEFKRNQYNLLITTGFPYNNGFTMGSGGSAIFHLQNHVKPGSDSLYTITLTIRGTKVSRVFAHVWIYAGNTRLGDCYSTRFKKEYTFTIKLALPPEVIRLEFDNDTYTNRQDRDLFIYSIKVNEYVLAANNPQVAFYEKHNGSDSLVRLLSHSSAINAANYLVNSGIPDSLVVPVETRERTLSKTYETAIDVRQRLTETNLTGKRSITVFSQGPHARRSYISFKKAFGDMADIGVISLSDNETTRSNWWKTWKGWKKIIYETVGVVYASVML